MHCPHLSTLYRATGIVVITSVLTLTSACSQRWVDHIPFVYSPDIQQGNLIDELMLHKLEYGMSKDDVTEILGTPLIQTTFRQGIWYYTYTLEGKSSPRQQRTVILSFNDDDHLLRITGDVIARTGPVPTGDEERRRVITVPDAPRTSLFSWKRNNKRVEPATEQQPDTPTP